MNLPNELKAQILDFQRNEITEHHIYIRLADAVKSKENSQVLRDIAGDELRHYEFWKGLTGQDVRPDWKRVRFYTWVSRIFGLTFGIKLMERGEEGAQESYGKLSGKILEAEKIIKEENGHEAALLDMLDEERLEYVGSIVLGLNDALVELTGSLAGLTLALRRPRLIALSGLIVGVAASLSMAASEYLSKKAEKTGRDPVKSSLYTGIAYIFTVTLLVLPYLILSNPYWSLFCTMFVAVVIIAAFNYYISVAKDEPFRRQFVEMAVVSLGVAALSFGLGYLIRIFLGVDV